jgi:hypothetical protein
MSENVDSMVREAIKKQREGKKAEARALLEKATEIDQNNEKAWLWLSAVVDSPEDQRVCLENVLFLNPDNENAKRGLAVLDANHPRTETPASDDYSVPTSSASATFDTEAEVSSDEYDEWISDMNLGGDSGTSTNPFTVGMDDFDDVFANAFDEDDPFGVANFEEDLRADALLQDGEEAHDYGDNVSGVAEDEDYVDDIFATEVDSDLEVEDDDFDDFSGGGLFMPDETGEYEAAVTSSRNLEDDQDPGYYFRNIPDNIKATGLPGSRGVPVLSLVLLIILLAANAGAIAVLTMS